MGNPIGRKIFLKKFVVLFFILKYDFFSHQKI